MNQMSAIASASGYRARFTTSEFLHMVESGAFADMQVELVDGDLVKMMPSFLAHGEANVLLAARLLSVLQGRARIAVDLLVQCGPDTIRAADIAAVSTTAPRDRPIAPADVLLLVEIAASTLAVDLGTKLTDYAVAEIPHYWVVDLEASVVHTMERPVGGRYELRSLVRFGEPLAVPGTDAHVVID
jgi:Uma2 family endonuclease